MRGTNNQRHSANPEHTQTAFLFIQLHTNLQYVWHPRLHFFECSLFFSCSLAPTASQHKSISSLWLPHLLFWWLKRSHWQIAKGIEPSLRLYAPKSSDWSSCRRDKKLNLAHTRHSSLTSRAPLLELRENSALTPPLSPSLLRSPAKLPSGQCAIQSFLPPFFRVCNDYLLQTDIQ